MSANTRFAVAVLLGCAACGALTPRSISRPLLENEGEVLLYLQPVGQETQRLNFTLSALAAVRVDGVATPLELTISQLPGGDDAGRQRLLARGRLPPGTYRGLEATVSRATVMAPDGPAELLVSKDPTAITTGFAVQAQRVTVLWLTFKHDASLQTGFAFTPQFGVAVPPRPLPVLDGVSSNAGMNDLTLFDKRRREAFSVIATGREPLGVALGPGLSRMFVALSGEDRVAVFDLITGEPLPDLKMAAGDRPRELAVTSDGRTVLVLNQGSNSLSFMDASSGLEQTRVATGSDPVALLVDRSFRRAYVLNQGSSTMTVVDVTTRTPAASVGTDPLPLRAQLNRNGNRLYVVHGGSPQMLVYSLPDLSVITRINVGLGAATLKVDPRSDMIYLAKRDEPRLYVYDATSLIPIDFFDVSGGVSWLAIDDTENTLLALMPSLRGVAVIDIPSRRELGIVPVGDDPYMVTVAEERF
jgi:YVTN family beta-propeller protein